MKKILIFIGVFITGAVIWVGYYQLNGVTTEGYFAIQEDNILEENGKYYIFLEGRKIEVSEDLFEKIQVNHQYQIEYKWNKFSPNDGKIVRFDLDS